MSTTSAAGPAVTGNASERATEALLMAAVGMVYLAISLLTFNQIEEDAFIYFRFAANLADGHGYVFNVGGEPIESGSSLLWQMLLVPVRWISSDMVVATKCLGIGIGLACLVSTWRLSRRVVRDPFLRIAPAALLATSIPFYCWMQRGLETPLHLFLLLAFAQTLCNPAWTRLWFVPASAVIVSRPEGFLFSAVVVPLLFRPGDRRRLLPGLLPLGLFCVGLYAIRFSYFQDLVPHPFYIKLRTSETVGIQALTAFLVQSHLYVLAIPSLAMLVLKGVWRREDLIVASFAALGVFWAIQGEDWKPYNRHLVPALPFVFVLCARGLELVIDRWAPVRVPLRVGVLLFVITTALTSGAITRYQRVLRNPIANFAADIQESQLSPAAYLAGALRSDLHRALDTRGSRLRDPIVYNRQATVGAFLAANYPSGTTVVHDQMGQVPWYAGREMKFIDSGGLLDRRIGFFRFQERAKDSAFLGAFLRLTRFLNRHVWKSVPRANSLADVLAHVFESDPHLIMVSEVLANNPGSLQRRIENDPRLRERYRPGHVVNRVRVYERRDLPELAPATYPEYARVGRRLERYGGDR